jgi:chromosome segregation ATPase
MTSNAPIATAESVQAAVESLLRSGTPLPEITQEAVRAELGGGSMSTIQRHLKAIREKSRGAAAERENSADTQQQSAPTPEAARVVIERLKATADELGGVIVELIDGAVAGERHRQEHAQERERSDHRQARGALEAEVNQLEEMLDETAREGRECEASLRNSEARAAQLEEELRRAREVRDDLQRQLSRASKHLDLKERETYEKDQYIARLLDESRSTAKRLASTERRAEDAEARIRRAEDGWRAAERMKQITQSGAINADEAEERAQHAQAGWRRAEASCAEAQARAEAAEKRVRQAHKERRESEAAWRTAEAARAAAEVRARAAEEKLEAFGAEVPSMPSDEGKPAKPLVDPQCENGAA